MPFESHSRNSRGPRGNTRLPVAALDRGGGAAGRAAARAALVMRRVAQGRARSAAPVTPTDFNRMSEGGQLMVWGMRHWMVATLQARDVPVSVLRSFEAIGGARLYATLTAMLLIAARDADRPLLIHPPCCGELSADEEHITRVLAALTHDAAAAAAVHFRALLGREPSAALARNAKLIAGRFKAMGFGISVGTFAHCGDLAAASQGPAEVRRDA